MRAGTRQRIIPEVAKQAISLVGGRLSFLNRICHAKDMLAMARHLLAVEKAWLLSRIGIATRTLFFHSILTVIS
jgi:hypothetical protein